MQVYRYTTNGEGVWSAGKRLLPPHLVEEANQSRAWLTRPDLPEGNFRFWLTEKGKQQYESTLYLTHQKYLAKVTLEEVSRDSLGEIVYEDEYQVVEKV